MKKRLIFAVIPALALTGLAGCDMLIRSPDSETPAEEVTPQEDTAPVEEVTLQPAAVAPVELAQISSQKAEIDWTAAREDVASSSSNESNGNFSVASQGDAPPVPVMLPTGIVLPQGAESDVKFQPLTDGYFAFYPGTEYNIVVNGTNEVLGDRSDRPTYSPMRYEQTMSGAQVAFTKYGADYLIEFECTTADGGHADCISEEDALSIAENLVAVRSR